jgi:hypothetical protein
MRTEKTCAKPALIAGRNDLTAVRPFDLIKASDGCVHQREMAVAPGAADRGNAHTKRSNHRKYHSPNITAHCCA